MRRCPEGQKEVRVMVGAVDEVEVERAVGRGEVQVQVEPVAAVETVETVGFGVEMGAEQADGGGVEEVVMAVRVVGCLGRNGRWEGARTGAEEMMRKIEVDEWRVQMRHCLFRRGRCLFGRDPM
jgi:hypothetical protein